MSDTIKKINQTEVSCELGDITRQQVDAIVNAANSSLMGGGGVDGAIHRAGGPTILQDCKKIRETRGQCAPGDAVITRAGNLQARYVIHTVGPIWHGGQSREAETLHSAYRTSLNLAAEACCNTIAFPSISTGAYGYPVELAAQVALSAVADFCKDIDTLKQVRFVLFDRTTLDAYKSALSTIEV